MLQIRVPCLCWRNNGQTVASILLSVDTKTRFYLDLVSPTALCHSNASSTTTPFSHTLHKTLSTPVHLTLNPFSTGACASRSHLPFRTLWALSSTTQSHSYQGARSPGSSLADMDHICATQTLLTWCIITWAWM